jgi:hypothetical protein
VATPRSSSSGTRKSNPYLTLSVYVVRLAVPRTSQLAVHPFRVTFLPHGEQEQNALLTSQAAAQYGRNNSSALIASFFFITLSRAPLFHFYNVDLFDSAAFTHSLTEVDLG